MNHPIDYFLISRAIDFYAHKGFKYVEAPWMVGPNALNSTLPPGKNAFWVEDWHELADKSRSALVGSAEQGFVQLMLDGRLPLGSHMAAGPCFRDDEVDELHQKTFFKVELIIVMDYAPPPEFALKMAHEDALEFFYQNTGLRDRLLEVETEAGYDINLNGIEIGSYGVRSFEGHHWIYGTGLAEPRFSMALAAGQKSDASPLAKGESK